MITWHEKGGKIRRRKGKKWQPRTPPPSEIHELVPEIVCLEGPTVALANKCLCWKATPICGWPFFLLSFYLLFLNVLEKNILKSIY